MKFLKYLLEFNSDLRDIQLNPDNRDYYEMRVTSEHDPKSPLVVRFIGVVKKFISYTGLSAIERDLRVAKASMLTHYDMYRALRIRFNSDDTFWGVGEVKNGLIDYSGKDHGIQFGKNITKRDIESLKKFFTNLTLQNKKYSL